MEEKNMTTINKAVSLRIPARAKRIQKTHRTEKNAMSTANYTTISMGKPITTPVLIPVEHKSTPAFINNQLVINGNIYGVTALSLGSPHGAVIVDDVDSADVPVLGAALGTHVLFPKGANIVFIQVLDKESIKVRLWQRGAGEVQFAGESVAVAGIAAMMLQKVLSSDVKVSVGGTVFLVKWNRGRDEVTLTGPSELLTRHAN